MVISERSLDAERKKSKRAAERDIQIPTCVNHRRRKRCEKDIVKFLKTYFPHIFTDPFTQDQLDMIQAILKAAQHGGRQAIAAPRGSGKTMIVQYVIIYCLLLGLLKFPVICAASGPDASRILNNIKSELEFNDLLWEDFPEVCEPIRALDGAPQRARMQTVNGVRTQLEWSADTCVLPTISKSKAGGAVLMTRGLDAAIRGINYRGRRPDLALIDDPETRESAASDLQCRQREEILERDISGLGGPGKRMAMVMLCTVQNRTCLAAKYTECKSKPAWNGKRYRLLVEKPEREDLWDEYMRLRREGQHTGDDKCGRKADAFFREHRKEMERGAVLGNPHRYTRDKLEDGKPKEFCALQHCYNLICDNGWESFCTEYQNDPVAEESIEDVGLTITTIAGRRNWMPKGEVPVGTVALTAGIDLGKRGCHWAVTAWLPNAAGFVVDYGVAEVNLTEDSDSGIERSVLNTLHNWREETQQTFYHFPDGEEKRLDCVFVDAGWKDQIAYKFCREAGKPYFPSKGFGTTRGLSPFRAPDKNTPQRVVGEHWYRTWNDVEKVWWFALHSDDWKGWIHERFKVQSLNPDSTPRPGSLSLFGITEGQRPEFAHLSYAKHITAEIEKEEFIQGKGIKRYWHQVHRNNHWFDSTYMASAAANVCGVQLIKTIPMAEARKASRGPAVQTIHMRPDGRTWI